MELQARAARRKELSNRTRQEPWVLKPGQNKATQVSVHLGRVMERGLPTDFWWAHHYTVIGATGVPPGTGLRCSLCCCESESAVKDGGPGSAVQTGHSKAKPPECARVTGRAQPVPCRASPRNRRGRQVLWARSQPTSPRQSKAERPTA